MKFFISLILVANSLWAEEMVTSVEMFNENLVQALTQMLEAVNKPQLCDPCNDQEEKSKVSSLEDENCIKYLVWGHSDHAKEFLRRNHLVGIGQGCNSGNGSVGKVKSLFQRGPNGTYAQQAYQGTQNAGMSPLILSTDTDGLLLTKNSHIGFMRMTQYHFLSLIKHSQENSSNCSKMLIKFHCVDDDEDLHDGEYQKRFNAIIKHNDKKDGLKEENLEQLELLQRFELLKNCFGDKRLAVPTKCGEDFEFSPDVKIAKHCLEWMKSIEARPKMSWETAGRLAPEQQEKYPPQGKLH
jgi:hypothetical protein